MFYPIMRLAWLVNMDNHTEARDFIIEEIKKEVFGPEPIGEEIDTSKALNFDGEQVKLKNGPYIQMGTGQEILTQEIPTQKYGAGVLYPVRYDSETTNEENLAGITSDEGTEEIKEIKEYEGDEKTIKFSGTEEEEFELSGANVSKFQSSMGISFYCELALGDKIIIQNPDQPCGAYSLAKTYIDGNLARNGYYIRRDIKFNAVFNIDEKFLNNDRKVITPLEINNIDNIIDLEFNLFVRPHKDSGNKIITATIINRTNTDLSEKNQLCLFQSGFKVFIKDEKDKIKKSFIPYPKGELHEKINSENDEEQILDLIYKNNMNYAIGHGCTAEWKSENEKCIIIEAVCLPTIELPNTTAEIESSNSNFKLEIPMNVLAGIVNKDKFELLNKMAEEYKLWVDNEKVKIVNLPKKHIAAAKKNIDKCYTCLQRIIDGINFIKNDKLALKAFELANESILIQQFRLSNKLREISFNKAGDTYFEDQIVIPNLEEDHQRLGKWRPFQLAFLLSSIKSSVLELDLEREDVELIFFPTGGGKTEAYLGLASFASFYRRLLDKDDDGVQVLMRYTLRLLTAQQFTRASGVICAMEFIRRREEEKLGAKKFSIGLWVGGANTPNKNDKANGAVALYNKLVREKNAKYPFVLSKCPWCASHIGKVTGQRSAVLVGLDNKDGRIIFAKHDPNCEFNQGLPIFVVDEDIYDEKPTIIIATVDKFAQLAWSPSKIKSLFGMGDNGKRKKSPPSLILQDELHLITGPLGSMVGIYEVLIEELCSDRRNNKVIRPKIVCSTATIRSYHRQIKDLYNRTEVNLFPPLGLDNSDSFFSKHAMKNGKFYKPKKYIGLMTPNYPSPQTTQVRIYSRLLHSANKIPAHLRDPFFTLMNFFGSIREIQTTHSLIQVDIRTRLKFLSHRYGDDHKVQREIQNFIELTSRIPSEDVPATIDQLSKEVEINGAKKNYPVDICNASNIIEVGIDIDRLALLTVLGQPKTTSSYIQVTGRIGRRWKEKSGVVFTIYNNKRPRDKSHFEQFNNYHSKLYAQVEPMSVTPFANPVINRALHAVVIAYVRIYGSSENDTPNPFPKDAFLSFQKIILDRVKSVDPKELAAVKSKLDEISENWQRWKHQSYELDQAANDGLMYRSGNYVIDEIKPYSYETPTSLRNVDAECRGKITNTYREME